MDTDTDIHPDTTLPCVCGAHCGANCDYVTCDDCLPCACGAY